MRHARRKEACWGTTRLRRPGGRSVAAFSLRSAPAGSLLTRFRRGRYGLRRWRGWRRWTFGGRRRRSFDRRRGGGAAGGGLHRRNRGGSRGGNRGGCRSRTRDRGRRMGLSSRTWRGHDPGRCGGPIVGVGWRGRSRSSGRFRRSRRRSCGGSGGGGRGVSGMMGRSRGSVRGDGGELARLPGVRHAEDRRVLQEQVGVPAGPTDTSSERELAPRAQRE